MQIINLTPHQIVVGEGFEALTLPSTGLARVREEYQGEPVTLTLMSEQETYDDQGMPWWPQVRVRAKSRTQATGLPPESSGTWFLVSQVVADACPDRRDLLVPDTGPESAIRDAQGRIIGVRWLNPGHRA